jgi:protein-L-isoaspartate(D-aspartate) O-methyltransferase
MSGADRGPSGDASAQARARMVRDQLERRGIRDHEVLAAMGSVPRERFLPETVRHRAYEDGAVPIGRGQTISQPFIVARMTEALALTRWVALHPGERPRVLDVGTGSGYQAAVLAAMGVEVISIERDATLAAEAERLLGALGFDVKVVVGDGTEGWPASAPYAGIVVAAASPAVPPPLVEQLGDGGRLIVPVGPRDRQELVVVQRLGERTERTTLEPAVFVPLVGRHGFD